MIDATTAPSPVVSTGLRTRGHDRAVALVRTMIAGRTPHALLISGPPGVGKTTLALDLAAGLLCDDPNPAARPCRACRACRLVDRGLHPDLHRIAPSGPADQIRIGDRDRPDSGTVRRLSSDLVLLSVEGGARVAILERADRLTDDAQTALLKTLEEPPSGVTIVLCADDEERLMPTVRSRCTRIRLGPVAIREIEAILAAMDVAEPPLAARLARLASGRPGVARTLALAPDAVAARDEIARTLLDLLAAGPAARLAAARDLSARAGDLARALDRATGDASGEAPVGRPRGGRGRTVATSGRASSSVEPTEPGPSGDDGDDDAAPVASASAADRRRAVSSVIGIWRDLVRDLLLVRLGDERQVRDLGLLDDLRAAATRLGTSPDSAEANRMSPANPDAVLAGFLARLDAVGELVEANARPELALDSLLLGWPRTGAE
ncbi:MAG: polymerase subunit delta [Chloroflexota bacterium]|nr:polymerase subunit delta [Chloroflexota bacterium]